MSGRAMLNDEEEYFARKEAALLNRPAVEDRKRVDVEEDERRRLLHFMKCPKCGKQLEEIQHEGLYIDKCSGCDGIWFDRGELEIVRKNNVRILDTIQSLFRR